MERGIIFDLDGTLVDSLPGIAEGVNRALDALGKPRRTQEEVRGMIGRGARNLCAQAIGYADADETPANELEPMHEAFLIHPAGVETTRFPTPAFRRC